MMTTVENSEPKAKLGTAPFVLGGLAFIPLIGVLFGIICIVWGSFTHKIGGKKLAAIGCAGILFTFVIYGALFYFGFEQRGGMYDDLRKNLAQSTINSIVPSIEMYKIQFGTYPDSIDKLKDTLPKNGFVSIYDPSDIKFGRGRQFYYERVDSDHYYLRGVGPDGIPFTNDDIVPEISTVPGGKLGLLTERLTQP